MKTLFLALALVCTLTLCPASYASPLTFYVTNGTFQSGGTFSGYYTLDSVTDKITGGQFTIDDLGSTSTSVWLRTPPYNPGPTNTDAMFSGSAGLLYFSVSLSPTAPVLCTYLNDPTCGLGDDTALQYGNPIDDNFDSATSANISPTPEPSSLILLATGALGAIPIIRRRLARRT